jgi:hypothetical protein
MMRILYLAGFALSLSAFADGDGLNAETSPAQSPPAAEGSVPTPPATAMEPNISGVPQEPEGPAAPTTADEVRNAPGGDEPDCKSKVDPALRAMVFKHYSNFQDMQLAQGQPLPPNAPDKCAHLLGMVMKESAGDSTDVTDMKSHEVGTYRAMSDLTRWNALFSHGNLTYDKQTNYGLAQQSMDRLLAPSGVSGTIGNLVSKLTGSSGQGVAKLLSFYQSTAQGRVSENDNPIPQKDAQDPNAPQAVKDRARAGLKAAVWHCGSRFLFKEGYAGADGEKQLEDAMASIAYCDIGAKNPNPKNQDQAKCFARWVTLCPALNLDIAILTPDSYFATNKAPPLCGQTFKKLTKTPAPAKK